MSLIGLHDRRIDLYHFLFFRQTQMSADDPFRVRA